MFEDPSIKHEGHKSPFLRLGKGIFALREFPGIAEKSISYYFA